MTETLRGTTFALQLKNCAIGLNDFSGFELAGEPAEIGAKITGLRLEGGCAGEVKYRGVRSQGNSDILSFPAADHEDHTLKGAGYEPYRHPPEGRAIRQCQL